MIISFLTMLPLDKFISCVMCARLGATNSIVVFILFPLEFVVAIRFRNDLALRLAFIAFTTSARGSVLATSVGTSAVEVDEEDGDLFSSFLDNEPQAIIINANQGLKLGAKNQQFTGSLWQKQKV